MWSPIDATAAARVVYRSWSTSSPFSVAEKLSATALQAGSLRESYCLGFSRSQVNVRWRPSLVGTICFQPRLFSFPLSKRFPFQVVAVLYGVKIAGSWPFEKTL